MMHRITANQRRALKRSVVPPGTALPPARPGVRYVRVPGLGIVVADDGLRDHVERTFERPMIVLALLVLPLLVIDFIVFTRVQSGGGQGGVFLLMLARFGFAVIWLAFLVEFVIRIAIAESRIEYVKRHWIDLVIILVPVLRPLRAAAIAKTSRVYTLRGVGLRFARSAIGAIVGLEATERLLDRFGISRVRNPRPPTESMTRDALGDEVKKLRTEIDAWDRWWTTFEDYRLMHGLPPIRRTPPGGDSDPH